MRNFDTIVCPLDLRPSGDRALPHVAALARARRIAVEMVTVVDELAASASALVELGQRAERCGLLRPQLTVIHSTSPGTAIGEHVSGRDGVILLIATTAHGGYDEHQLGPVTDEVLGRAHQPVVVVGPRAEPSGGCLLVVTDDHGSADVAVPVVERWSSTFGDGPIRIVELQALDAWPAQEDDGTVSDVGRYVDQLGRRGIVATGEVVRGLDPVGSIVDHIARTDVAMVVVTSPPVIGEPTHWFHTARRLIRFSSRPLLVVPADRRAAASR